MAAPFAVQTVTIPLSGTLSTIIEARAAAQLAVLFPLLDSAQVYVAAAFTATSADFRRVYTTDGSTHHVIAAAVGSVAISLTEVARVFPYLRLETSTAQASTRACQVLGKA